MIIFNGRFFSRRPTGVDRFAIEVISSINDLIGANDPLVGNLEFKIMLPAGVSPSQTFTNIPMENIGRNQGLLWEHWDLPRAVPSDALLVSLCNTGPAWLRSQLVVIHDATPVRVPLAFSLSFRLWYRLLMPLLGRMSKKIVTVSAFSKQEIVSAYGIPREKISVVGEGGEHILQHPIDIDAIQRFGLSERPFVLAVSSMAANKNFKLILEAMAYLDDFPFDFAIAGGVNSRIYGDAGLVSSEQVKWLGYVSDAELHTLYKSAMCFVFPSIYEGFGIPLLEAMNCGCPVIASTAASIPEVGGEAALYFDPNVAQELAALLRRVTNDPSLREELSAKGHERAEVYSWKKAARQLLAIISDQ